MKHNTIPVLGFAAWSGTGKTTLLKNIISILKKRNIRTGIIKHAHHDFDIDHAGKDSYELRKAGADQMLIGSKKRWALIVENQPDSETTLDDFINQLNRHDLDIILVEGFKPEKISKIELVRPALGREPFYPTDKSIIAVAADDELPVSTNLPVLDLNKPGEIADFIIDFMTTHDRKIDTGT